MFKHWFPPKFDGVVTAIRYAAGGQVEWVRAFERRGPTWSDRLILDRQELIERIKKGKRFFAGKRIEFMASEFELGPRLQVLKSNGSELLVTGDVKVARQDTLPGIPQL